MEVVFDNPYGKEFDWLNERYSEIAKAAFSYLDVKENYEIDVSLVDDETIHQINRDYRNVDRVTDVISFAFNDDKDPNDQINSLEVQKMLGEILICLPQAKRQQQCKQSRLMLRSGHDLISLRLTIVISDSLRRFKLKYTRHPCLSRKRISSRPFPLFSADREL